MREKFQLEIGKQVDFLFWPCNGVGKEGEGLLKEAVMRLTMKGCGWCLYILLLYLPFKAVMNIEYINAIPTTASLLSILICLFFLLLCVEL